jgi:protein O-GlcNAcase / histone acetyltransferase
MAIIWAEPMAYHNSDDFLAGVIEGFYGQPWTQAERSKVFSWLADWGLNTYVYAPKDDLHHRALWRELYSEADAGTLKALIQDCLHRRIRFVYALSPGLDVRYSHESDLDFLRNRFAQMLALGCRHFALLFDDIPDRMEPSDLELWGSLAAAQGHIANSLFTWTRERVPQARLLFCPTPYCGRMAQRKLGGEDYLNTLGCVLLPEIDVFWTGPEIISKVITAAHAREFRSILRRKPLIWDNLHANDYDGRRFYCGPYAGRPLELRSEVAGLLSNPNSECALNYVPLRTLANFLQAKDTWDARQAYLSAIQSWLPQFETRQGQAALEDVVLLGDCYYLPYEDGPAAEALYAGLRGLLTRNPKTWGDQTVAIRKDATRLRDFCGRLTELRDRPLFYALHRRLWELREELDLVLGYVEFKSRNQDLLPPYSSDFHRLSTYRGGWVARLQQLLIQEPDGSFIPSPHPMQ